MWRRSLVTLVALTLAGGCATVSVKTDFDPSADFSGYRTFQLLNGVLMIDGRPDVRNTLVLDRIRAAITSELTQRGLQPVATGGDVGIAFVAGARTVTEIESVGPSGPGWGPYWGGGGWWGAGYMDWWTRTYTKGTLVIDVMDARTQKLVWRAYLGADVNSPDASTLIKKGVHKAFDRYPPKRA
jgi:hypothetical protein